MSSSMPSINIECFPLPLVLNDGGNPSLLQNSIDKSPIVFLKLSEDEVGEYDLVGAISSHYCSRRVVLQCRSGPHCDVNPRVTKR